jgi:hypothetical protein
MDTRSPKITYNTTNCNRIINSSFHTARIEKYLFGRKEERVKSKNKRAGPMEHNIHKKNRQIKTKKRRKT